MGDGRLLELGTETYTNLVEYRLCYLMLQWTTSNGRAVKSAAGVLRQKAKIS